MTAPGPGRLRALLLEPAFQRGALLAAAALVLLARAGRGPLANYDDCYYAEKAREMLRTGDWLSPHFAGVLRLDNPPLVLWLMAASFAVMGVSGFAAVFPSAVSGVACIALVHRLARRLGRDAFEAWAAAVVLLTTGYFAKYAGHAMFDVVLTLLFVLALLAHRRAVEGRRAAWLALGALAGLGVLAKSVLGLFPLLVALLHAAWERRLRRDAGGFALAALATLATFLPWYAYQNAVHPDVFLREHVRWLLWERGFVAGHGAPPPAPPFAYLAELAKVYWPWLPAALAGLALAARDAFARDAAAEAAGGWSARATARLLVLWPVVVVGVMSVGNEKKLWYVMSVFPCLALLAARALGAAIPGARARERVVLGGFALLAAAGAVLALTPWFAPPPRRPDLQVIAHAARTLVPDGARVVYLDGAYSSLANQFVFYSGRDLDGPAGDPARVRAALAAGRWALLAPAGYARVVGADSSAFPVVVGSGGWALVHRAPRPAVTLAPTNAFE